MGQKKSINIGFRGWMLVVWLMTAFLSYIVLGNYPLNILADMYGGAQTLSMIYTIASIIGIIVQLIFSNFIGKLKSIRGVCLILGVATLACTLGIMFIPMQSVSVWQIVYGLGTVISVMYGTFAISILVGQWFPTRKGTIMGIATLAFPIGNGLIGPFAGKVFAGGVPNIVGGFMPFFIVFVIGWIIGLIFIKDYPEQVGCYRDNDKSMTADVAKAMMLEEIENKKTTVWSIGHTLSCRDYWLMTIPMGALLMFSVGMMTQTSAIIGQFGDQLNFVGGYSGVMLLICVFGCIGSYILGLLDTRLGTKKAVLISVIIMVIAGILGAIRSPYTLLAAMICLALFMGASSNFTVSTAAQYWRREDFSSVFAVINPVANIFNSLGPVIIARLLYSTMGYQSIFIATAVAGVISVILVLLFSQKHLKEVDDKYRQAAGKPLDDVLLGRK